MKNKDKKILATRSKCGKCKALIVKTSEFSCSLGKKVGFVMIEGIALAPRPPAEQTCYKPRTEEFYNKLLKEYKN